MPATGGRWRALTDGRRYDDKPRWSPDGRTIYYVSDAEGILNVWGRRFDPVQGLPIGSAFRVTSFDRPSLMVSSQRIQMLFALTEDQLFLPVMTTTGELWILDGLRP